MRESDEQGHRSIHVPRVVLRRHRQDLGDIPRLELRAPLRLDGRGLGRRCAAVLLEERDDARGERVEGRIPRRFPLVLPEQVGQPFDRAEPALALERRLPAPRLGSATRGIPNRARAHERLVENGLAGAVGLPLHLVLHERVDPLRRRHQPREVGLDDGAHEGVGELVDDHHGPRRGKRRQAAGLDVRGAEDHVEILGPRNGARERRRRPRGRGRHPHAAEAAARQQQVDRDHVAGAGAAEEAVEPRREAGLANHHARALDRGSVQLLVGGEERRHVGLAGESPEVRQERPRVGRSPARVRVGEGIERHPLGQLGQRGELEREHHGVAEADASRLPEFPRPRDDRVVLEPREVRVHVPGVRRARLPT